MVALRARNVSEVKRAIEEEIGDPHEGDQLFSDKAFPHLQTTHWVSKIKDFVDSKTTLYNHDAKRWTGIPTATTLEKALYDPFCAIINAVISHFDLGNREAKNTSKTYVQHKNADDEQPPPVETLDEAQLEERQTASNTRLKSSPDIMILAKGGSCFELEDYPPSRKLFAKQAFQGCATPLDMKTDNNTDHKQHMLQIGLYSRECFARQQNRIHVHSAIITQSIIQVYQFNRSRVVRSSRVNYHKDPYTFVRMLVGLIGSDDTSLGFDPSFSWQGAGTGRVRAIRVKVGLAEDSPHQNAKVEDEIWSTDEICGRATHCWKVKIILDNKPVDGVIKDIWISESRVKEWEFLQKIEEHNLKGVVHTLSYETLGTALSHESIKGIFYPGLEAMTSLLLHDRTWCRFLFKAYGLPLEHATTPKQLLEAFLDAVLGHWGLWQIGILHRDASENNVLMGVDDTKGKTEGNTEGNTKDSAKGNRGILIDLDMAIWTNREESSKTDKRTGTRMFQSMKILDGANIPHNHLDDLESFFYILLLLVLKRKGPAGPLNEQCPAFLEEWSNPKASTSYAYKYNALSRFKVKVLDNIPEGWAQPIKTLLNNLRDFVWKHATAEAPPPPPGAKTVAALNPNADEHYKEFVGHVKGALKALSPSEDESDTDDAAPDTTENPSGSVLSGPASPSPLSGAAAAPQTPVRFPQGGAPAISTPLPLSRRKATSAQSPLSISTVFPSIPTFNHIRGTKRSNDHNPQTPAKRSKLSGISGVSPTRSPGNGPPSPRKDFTPSPVDNTAADDADAESFFQDPASPGPGPLFGRQREHSAQASSKRKRNSLTRQKSLDKNHS